LEPFFLLSGSTNQPAHRWFSYVSSITLLQKGVSADSNDATISEVGLLIMIWVIPSFIFFPFGGVLSDTFDRRKMMILLNILGSFVTLGYILPYYNVSSKWLVYVITLFRQALTAMYEPCSQAILPMIVENPKERKKAFIQVNAVHALASTCGSAMGGLFVTTLGLLACLLIDSGTFLASALVTSLIGGTWKAVPSEDVVRSGEERSGRTNNSGFKFIIVYFCSMFLEGFKYLRGKFFGALIFLKFSFALMYGPLNTLLVVYSEMYRKQSGIMSQSSTILGILLACTGAGAILGGGVVEIFANEENPKKLQRDCIYPFLVMASAYILMGLSRSLITSCLCSCLIYSALTITWIESDLILQVFTSPEMMGRVISVDFALATTADGVSSYLCGVVQDELGISAHYVSVGLGLGSFVIFLCWSAFHLLGRGASQYSDIIHDPEGPREESGRESSQPEAHIGQISKVYCTENCEIEIVYSTS